MHSFLFWFLFHTSYIFSVFAGKTEHGSYVNLNPNTYEICPPESLVTLNSCSNILLDLLDQCIPDDNACACCALQSIDQTCYSLCPSQPSSLFLAVLTQDCKPLNDVNACNLPFKVDDEPHSGLKKLISHKFKQFSDDIDINELAFFEPPTENVISLQQNETIDADEKSDPEQVFEEIAQMLNYTTIDSLNVTMQLTSNYSIAVSDSSGSITFPKFSLLWFLAIVWYLIGV